MAPSALVLAAHGAEEAELVCTVDVLRRTGIEVTLAGVAGTGAITGANNMKIEPDTSLDAVKGKTFDAVVLPGGNGATDVYKGSAEVGELLKAQQSSDRLIAAICAAPLALQKHGIHTGKKATCYPACVDDLKKDYDYQEVTVVEDGNLITSRGPGTAFNFGIAIATRLVGKDVADQVFQGMLLKA